MFEILSINATLFTVAGYSMSYIEFFGTIFYAWSVWLAAKNHFWTWPTSLVGVFLFCLLFYQIQLYSDFVEQIYFFITGILGWWMWFHPKSKKETDDKKQRKISYNSQKTNITYLLGIIATSAILGYFMSKIHLILPQFFPEPATFVYPDALTTIMSLLGQILLAQKRIENWYLWIAVDVIAIVLYFQKGILFVSFIYAVFLIIAIKGCLEWKKIYKMQHAKEEIA